LYFDTTGNTVLDKKVTVPELTEMKKRGQRITALTAYDYIFGLLLDQAGIDLILVGDSAAMVFAGHQTTLPLTLDEAIYHCKAVRRGVKRALLVADMPFLSFQVSPEQAVQNAGEFFKQAEVEAVKIEGGAPILKTVEKIVQAGMPVMGHLGLTPQSIRKFGGYGVRARSEDEAQQLVDDALGLQDAGAFAIVLEKIPDQLAKRVTEELSIPTIGIGAGPFCDGQILVTHDMLGLFEQFKPKFVRRYAELGETIRQACQQYIKGIREGDFPGPDESYKG